MFNTLTLELEHCYGIRKLQETLEADDRGSFAVYAPNGMMKTSLAKVFKDIAEDRESQDELFPDRQTVRRIRDEKGRELEADSVLVIPPYSRDFGQSQRVSTLLVNPELREKYAQLQGDVAELQNNLLRKLATASGRRKGLSEEISDTFMSRPDRLMEAFQRIRGEVEEAEETPFSDIPYNDVFNDRVARFLAKPEVKGALENYVDRLNALLDESPYFSKETFSYYGAEEIAKALAKHKFFDADHAIELRGEEALRLTESSQLTDLVGKERERIAEDADLKERLTKIDKLITGHNDLRKFKAVVDQRPEILPLLDNPNAFRQDVWKSYLVERKQDFLDLMDAHEASVAERKEIQDQAKGEETHWHHVIDVFNRRFSVPFKLRAKNHVEVVLGTTPALELAFEFENAGDSVGVERDQLIDALSQGERRAMYLLDVLFEIEARRRNEIPTLFIFDDVADSFDYKNKYAILQYLEEIKDWPDSRMLILTHNFDFLRAVEGTIVHRSRCKLVVRTEDGLAIKQVDGLRNIFTRDWKKHLFDDSLKRLASIPFVRNLVEYSKGEDNEAYAQLTSLLHWQESTAVVKQEALDQIFNSLFGTSESWQDADQSVWDAVVAEADKCLVADEGMNLANKIVLAMAARVLADRYMLESLGEKVDHDTLDRNQTRKLFSAFQKEIGEGDGAYDALHRVVLMTPEHLHLNAFMYEPLIDLDDKDLRRLYADVKGL